MGVSTEEPPTLTAADMFNPVTFRKGFFFGGGEPQIWVELQGGLVQLNGFPVSQYSDICVQSSCLGVKLILKSENGLMG